MPNNNNRLQKPNDCNTEQEQWTLYECLTHALDRCLSQAKHMPRNLYSIVLEEVELSLINTLIKYTENNHSKMAIILGLSRGTLRKKLKHYGFLC